MWLLVSYIDHEEISEPKGMERSQIYAIEKQNLECQKDVDRVYTDITTQ